MVKQIKKDRKVMYACAECGFAYKDKSWVQKCEAWCSEHSSCNLKITKHAIH